MIQEVMDTWRNEIKSDKEYQLTVKSTRPGNKNRQEALDEVVSPYEERIRKDVKQKGLGRDALVNHLGDEGKAFSRAHAFGADFVLSVNVPDFDEKSDEEKEQLRYEQAIFFLIWNSLSSEMMTPELHHVA